MNCNGPLARSFEDLRIGLSVLAGPLPEDAAAWRLELDAGPPLGSLSELRVATVFHEGRDVIPLAKAVTSNLEGFAARLAEAGVAVDAVSLPVSLADGAHVAGHGPADHRHVVHRRRVQGFTASTRCRRTIR